MNHTSKRPPQSEAKLGISLALSCYILWGVFPLYWSVLASFGLGPDQILAQRIVWCSVFALILLVIFRQHRDFLAAITQPKVLLIFFLAALTLSINWMTYIYGISINRVLDTSLGYFMSPIVSILLARIFIGERINSSQLLAVAFAGLGVLWLAFLSGDIPWLALILSSTWGIYSIFRKKAKLAVVPGFALETFLMLPFALLFLAWLSNQGTLVFSSLSAAQISVVISTGVVTALPLLLFAAAVKKSSLGTISILQYISPTIQFLIGLFIMNESFDLTRFFGYFFVWSGVIVFSVSSFRQFKKSHNT
ncbi:MAG: EamA family transporter RarD [Alcaligenaceae bacterium]|jgi:chloramphenicol-sensitive protein RarD|nr:EamA family transporter RarD [Alcaligenaceae bacterium]HZJ97428.1 EamA family transporter RarD [Oligella sp.]